MPNLPPAHHETSKRDSPNETKIKEKQNKTIPDSNSNLTKSMTHHNQTKELTTWFLILDDDEVSSNEDEPVQMRLQSSSTIDGSRGPTCAMVDVTDTAKATDKSTTEETTVKGAADKEAADKRDS
jgi:hypothetical protein